MSQPASFVILPPYCPVYRDFGWTEQKDRQGDIQTFGVGELKIVENPQEIQMKAVGINWDGMLNSNMGLRG